MTAVCILILLTEMLFLPQPRYAYGQAPATMQDMQLDSLVAPIALYPDPLLSQALVASTYPLELMQLQQFLLGNPYLKDQALVDRIDLKPWDPSIKAMAMFPEAVKRLSSDLQWTTDLGNAFLAQPAAVMDAIQRMRARALEKGTLNTGAEQTVQTEPAEGGNQIVTIEPTDPETVYVPYYDPTMAYGALAYPYPAIYYPPPGYYAPGAAVAFAVGVALVRARNGDWGYVCHWGTKDITVNNNNRYVRNSIRTDTAAEGSISRSSNAPPTKWQHNPVHRGGAPYGNRALADRYGNMIGNPGDRNRIDAPASTDLGSRLGGATGSVTKPSTRPSGGSSSMANRIGNQAPSSLGNAGAFDGGSNDFTQASSNRGLNSMGGGGGSRGGGARGGGGGRRR